MCEFLRTPQTSFILLAIRVICLLRLYWSPSCVTYSCRKKLQGSRNYPVRGRLLQPRHICGNVRRSLLEWTTRVDDEGDVTGLKLAYDLKASSVPEGQVNDSHIGGKPRQPFRCFSAAGERSRDVVPASIERIREIKPYQGIVLNEQTEHRPQQFLYLHSPS